MKKAALLFTLLCAGQLYGMEAENIGGLPVDVHNEMIKTALATSDNLEETIKVIQFASALRGIKYDNLKKLTALMDILAKKFPDISRKEFAEKLNTPIAKEYITLGEQLLWPANMMHSNKSMVEDVKKLIDKGADPNYSGGQLGYTALNATYMAIANKIHLEKKMDENLMAILNLLLNAGAKPDASTMFYLQKSVDKNKKIGLNTPEAKLDSELLDVLKPYADK